MGEPSAPHPHAPDGAAARRAPRRFGRVGRIPTRTPFAVGDVNAYVLLPGWSGGPLTLIDTGINSEESFEGVRHGLKEFGFQIEDIDRILITHAHMDHFGQAKRLRDLSGAVVHASEIEAERMRSYWTPSGQRDAIVLEYFRRWGVPEAVSRGDGGMAELARRVQDPIEVDVIVGDGDLLEVGDFALEVIATPGHCEGHVVFYEREMRWLFSGDHLLTDITPVPLLSFPKTTGDPRPRSLVRFMRSLERVEGLDCDLVFPSHGDVIRDHRELIAGYRLHHQRRALQILRYLERGPRTPFEIATRLFPRHYAAEIFLVMSEVVGHLDLLVDEGRVELLPGTAVERVRLAGAAGSA
jgi:glyoxylase-like metal-dependent hydrolase (beta-lactamase superfamily II)